MYPFLQLYFLIKGTSLLAVTNHTDKGTTAEHERVLP